MKTKRLSMLLIAYLLITFENTYAQCGTPLNLSSAAVNDSTSSLSWTQVAGASAYSIVVENGPGNPTIFLKTANVTSTNYVVNSLQPGYSYKYKVRTRCGTDKSSWSLWNIFVAGGGAINCTPVSGLQVTTTTGNTASFTWLPNPGGLGYAVRVEEASGNPNNFGVTSTTLTPNYTITGLNPSSNYKVKVRKRCAIGVTGTWSNWVFFTTSSLRIGETAGNNHAIHISPNPANQFIQVNTKTNMQVKSYQLFDLTGKIVLQGEVGESAEIENLSIPCQSLNKGIYFITIQTNEGKTTEKVIIQH